MSRRESNVDKVDRARLPARNLLAAGDAFVKYIDGTAKHVQVMEFAEWIAATSEDFVRQ
jgi:hypothetical protein